MGEPPLTPDAPLARKITEAIRSGDAAELQQLIDEHPAVARVRIGDPERGQSRTLLHSNADRTRAPVFPRLLLTAHSCPVFLASLCLVRWPWQFA